MVARAIALFNKEGKKAALDRFNKRPGPEFKHLDLYIFVLRARDATIVAHAQTPMFVGHNGIKLLDAMGISMGRLIMKRVTTYGSWADYWWKDPHTGKISPKSSWIVLYKGHIFGCGVHKK